MQTRCVVVKNSKRNARVLISVISSETKRKYEKGEAAGPRYVPVKPGCIGKFTFKSRESLHFVSVRGTDWVLLCNQLATRSSRLKIFCDGVVDDYDSRIANQLYRREERSRTRSLRRSSNSRSGTARTYKTSSHVTAEIKGQRSAYVELPQEPERLRRFVIFPALGPEFNGIITSIAGTDQMRKIGMPTLLIQYTMKPKEKPIEEWYMNQALLYAKVAAVRMKFKSNGREFYALVCQRPRDRDRAEVLILGPCPSSCNHLDAKNSLAPIVINSEQVKVGNRMKMVLLGIVRDFEEEGIQGGARIVRDIKKMGVMLASLSPGGLKKSLILWNDCIEGPVKAIMEIHSNKLR